MPVSLVQKETRVSAGLQTWSERLILNGAGNTSTTGGLIRSLTVGSLSPILLFHVAYLLVMGFIGLYVVSRRLDKLLLQ